MDRDGQDNASAQRRGEVLRFLLGGASTTLVSYAIYIALLYWLPYLLAYAIAYASGIVWSYGANTLFVFRKRPTLVSAALFPFVYVAQYVAGTLLLALLVEFAHVAQTIAPLIVIGLTLPLTYVLSRRIIAGKSLLRSADRPSA